MRPNSGFKESYSFVKQTLTVLVVDGKPDDLKDVVAGLAATGIFNIVVTNTARQAVEIIRSRRIHVCLMELDIKDVQDDEFYLPKTFSTTVRFIGISGIRSCARGGEAIRNGFCEVFDKPTDIRELVHRIFFHSVKNIFAPNAHPLRNNAIDRSISILMEQSPATVDQWAGAQGITTCTLREQWDKQGIPPRSAIFIWTLYNSAFLHFVKLMFNDTGELFTVRNACSYNKLLTMFYLKRSYWMEIIAQGTNRNPDVVIGETKTALSRGKVRQFALSAA